MSKHLFLVQRLRPSQSNFRVYGLVLSEMYQKVVLYVFSNEAFRFFPKLEEAWKPPSTTGFFNSISYPLWNKLSNGIKNRTLDLHKISVFVHDLKLWLSCETLTVSNEMYDLGDIQLGGGLKGWKFTKFHNVGCHYYFYML